MLYITEGGRLLSHWLWEAPDPKCQPHVLQDKVQNQEVTLFWPLDLFPVSSWGHLLVDIRVPI